tara:strand:+ start:183 stop:599 length:417 start_codon:yes stop_codon:yes gene_type:complete
MRQVFGLDEYSLYFDEGLPESGFYGLEPTTTRDARSAWVLMQYTGLKDKNGVEIYEGDICSILFKANRRVESVAEVKFENYQIKFWNDNEIVQAWYEPTPWYKSALAIYWHSCCFQGLEIEVIGNIYENPEILEAKDD